MNSAEHLELIELVFDQIEQDPRMHGSYNLYTSDLSRVDLNSLQYDGTDETLVKAMREPHTIGVLKRIMDKWAFIYSRYELLHTVWKQVQADSLDMEDTPIILQQKISHDLSALETIFYFDDWFKRSDSWTYQDRYSLVDDIKSFMQAIAEIKKRHHRLRKRALQDLLEGKHPDIAMDDIRDKITIPRIPWIRISLEHGLLTDNGDGTYTIVNSVRIFTEELLQYLISYYRDKGYDETKAKDKAIGQFPKYKEAVEKILQKNGKNYSPDAFKQARQDWGKNG